MSNAEEFEPLRKTVKLIDLPSMSVDELKAYAVSLENEIKRVLDAIAKKESHKSGLNALFGQP